MTRNEREIGWMQQAIARCTHMPDGDQKKEMVRHHFEAIREEAELLSVALPALAPEVRADLLDEAVLEVMSWRGEPYTNADQVLFDECVDSTFRRLELVAREQMAPKRLRQKLEQRRWQRHFRSHTLLGRLAYPQG